MPDISLLEPIQLRDVVQKLPYPSNLLLSNSLPKTPWPYPTVTWDVMTNTRLVAKPNVPNSEAHIVPRIGISQQSAAFIYLREKKVFEPTTLHWLRAPGSLTNLANAEQAVLREVTDLNVRFDNFVEWCAWQALTGSITFDYNDVQASVNTMVPASHKPTPGTGWSTATPSQIVTDIRAWKRLIARDGGVAARTVYLTDITMDKIFGRWVNSSTASVPEGLMSDSMRDQYYKTGTLPGFLGMDWTIVESFYTADNGTPTSFVPDNALFLVNLTENRPMEIFEGPTADDEAPDGFTGKFSKTWKEKDPSARQILLEYHFMPVITRPEQIVSVANIG